LVPASDLIALGALCAGVGTAAAIDIRRRRIPNAVCVALAGTGVALAIAGLSRVTVLSSLAGLAFGLVIMLPGHIIGATGAGDVKLFAAAGTLLGSERVIAAFLSMALVGGLLAIGIACWRGRMGRTLGLLTGLFGQTRAATRAIEAPAEHNRFPYGPAIAVGCVIAMVWR